MQNVYNAITHHQKSTVDYEASRRKVRSILINRGFPTTRALTRMQRTYKNKWNIVHPNPVVSDSDK